MLDLTRTRKGTTCTRVQVFIADNCWNIGSQGMCNFFACSSSKLSTAETSKSLQRFLSLLSIFAHTKETVYMMCIVHVLSTLGGKIILRGGSLNGLLMLMLGGLSAGFSSQKIIA